MPSLITFRSLTYAQRGAQLLERAGITATVTKAPQETAKRGCSYCVRLSSVNLSRSLRILENNRIPYNGVYRQAENGEYREVQP